MRLDVTRCWARLRWAVPVAAAVACASAPLSASAAINKEAITSYDRMQPGAPHWGYFNNAWQPFTAQSQRITRVGVTIGTPALAPGIAVPYTINVRICTTQPDVNGNCPNVLGQGTGQIVNYGNTYVDVGEVSVNPGTTYWAVWFQPAAAGGATWVTYWWAGGSTIATSDQMQMVVRGYNPDAVPPPDTPQNSAAPAPSPPTFHYAVANVVSVNLRVGPSSATALVGSLPGGAGLEVVCQTVGESVNGSRIWDRLESGNYISDWYTTTPAVGDYSPGIPHCDGAPAQVHPAAPAGRWSVVAGSSVNVRSGPGVGFDAVDTLAPGTRFDIVCQTYGTTVYGSPIWDMISDGRYVSDYFTDTPVFSDFSPGLDRCPGTGSRPADAPRPPAGGGGGTGPAPNTGVSAGSPSNCSADIVFVGARGSGEGDNGFGPTVWRAVGPVTRRFKARVRLDGLDYRYPAMKILDPTALLHFDMYLASVNSGTTAVLGSMRYQLAAWQKAGCRNKLHFLMAGYSQGAWAIGDAILQMSATERGHVDGVALFGDPRNAVAPGGIRDSGHVFPAEMRSRIRNVCRPADPVCDFTGDINRAVHNLPQHSGYEDNDAYDAGVFLADQLGRG